jgi:hypothetical protein
MGKMPTNVLQYRSDPAYLLENRFDAIMKRVEGRDNRCGDRTLGLEVAFTKKEFVAWGLAHREFQSLFRIWQSFGHPRKLAPSVERLDPNQGYTPANLTWVTQSSNSSFGGVNSQRVRKNLPKLTRTEYLAQAA